MSLRNRALPIDLRYAISSYLRRRVTLPQSDMLDFFSGGMMAEYRGCELPEDLFYDLDYVWAHPEEGGLIVLGITDAAQTMAGRVQKIRIKKVGTELAKGRHVATLESGKWAGGIPCPFAGTVESVNELVLNDPHLVNVGPYTDAWIAKVRPQDPAHAFDALMTGRSAIEALHRWIERYEVQCMRCAAP